MYLLPILSKRTQHFYNLVCLLLIINVSIIQIFRKGLEHTGRINVKRKFRQLKFVRKCVHCYNDLYKSLRNFVLQYNR